MPLLKRTYLLPAETVALFEGATAPGKRNSTLAAIMADWVDRKQSEKLERDILEGCREMAAAYLETEQEYHPLEEEVEGGVRREIRKEDRPVKRGRRSR